MALQTEGDSATPLGPSETGTGALTEAGRYQLAPCLLGTGVQLVSLEPEPSIEGS